MSSQYTHIGILVPVYENDMPAEQIAATILKRDYQNCDPEEYDSYGEALYCESDKKYILLGNTLFMHVDHKEEDCADTFAMMVEMPDGTIHYATSFYDGGTHLAEMLEDGYKERIMSGSVISGEPNKVDLFGDGKVIVEQKVDIKHVDSSPDDGFAIRILQAYLTNEEGVTTVTIPPQIGEILNESSRKRAVLLRKAIAKLRS